MEPSLLTTASPERADSHVSPLVDRRGPWRAAVASRCTLRLEDGSWRAALVVDLSLDGAGLWVGAPLSVASSVDCTLQSRGLAAGAIPATVVSVESLGHGVWRVGVHFARRLSPEVLAAALD